MTGYEFVEAWKDLDSPRGNHPAGEIELGWSSETARGIGTEHLATAGCGQCGTTVGLTEHLDTCTNSLFSLAVPLLTPWCLGGN